jgi:hypothetical protein
VEIRRTAGAITQNPGSTAAAAQALLAPSLSVLAAYAEKLAFLSGDDSLRPLNTATDALVKGIADGATTLQGALGGAALTADQVQTGVAAGQAIASFAAEQVLARALVPQVRRADGDVQKFAVFLKEMIGSPSTGGVRRALVRDRQIDTINWPTLLVGVAGDRSVGVGLIHEQGAELLNHVRQQTAHVLTCIRLLMHKAQRAHCVACQNVLG